MIEVALRHPFATLALDVAFTSQARTLALFGDSGAGKTSVLNAIAGLLDPEQGRISLDGRVLLDAVRGVRVPIERRGVGYVFQDGRLFPHLSVRANLLYGSPRQRDAANGFDGVVDLLELSPLLARRPDSLSGGERQRVAIGRALLSAPRILLLDEPLTGLHAEARAQVLGHLDRLKHEWKLATILVTHQVDEVIALADEVVHLHGGQAVAQQPVDAFAAGVTRPALPAHPNRLG